MACVAFSRDGARLHIVNDDRVWTYSATTGALQGSARLPHSAVACHFSADGSRLAVIDPSTVVVLDTSTWKVVRSVKKGAMRAVLSPSGRLLAYEPAVRHHDGTSSGSGDVTIIDVASGKRRIALESLCERGITTIRLAPDEKTFAVGCLDGALSVWKTSESD